MHWVRTALDQVLMHWDRTPCLQFSGHVPINSVRTPCLQFSSHGLGKDTTCNSQVTSHVLMGWVRTSCLQLSGHVLMDLVIGWVRTPCLQLSGHVLIDSVRIPCLTRPASYASYSQAPSYASYSQAPVNHNLYFQKASLQQCSKPLKAHC